MNRGLRTLALALVLCCTPTVARADLVTWMVTEWGSVYKNLEKVVTKKFEEPEQIAGTADHYYVSTRDGSVWRDGERIVDGFFKEMNVMDMDARGDDWYLLVLQGRLYKNGEVILPEGTIERPKALSVVGDDIWIMDDGGYVYKNGVRVNEERFDMRGYYPDHFAVSGEDLYFVVSGGTTGGSYVYRNRELANEETYIVREIGAADGDFYIFSGKSIFKNFERVARWEPDKAEITSHVDNPVDFHFVLP